MKHVVAIAVLSLIVLTLPDCDQTGWQPRVDCGRAGTACSQNGDCCSFACSGGACTCAPEGEHCLADVACCTGLQCSGERCEQGCRQSGVGCDVDGDCCESRCTDGVCAGSCGTNGSVCSTASDCCSGYYCNGGTCNQASGCELVGQSCDNIGNYCCGSLHCINGTCVEGTCAAQGGSCSGDYQCCTPLACDTTNHCEACGTSGATCAGQNGCCQPSSCQSGTCCRTPSETCTSATECCIVMYGTVVDARCNSQNRCCHAPNSLCKNNTDCCSGTCDTSGLCTCMPLGNECQSVFDCCMGSCNGGKCCIVTGQVCNLNSDCCSGVCKTNKLCM